ncbi:DUF1566 domain-containing protein [Aquipseudomonas campi]
MKRMITVTQGDITLKVPADTIASTFISAALAHIGGNHLAAANQDGAPALGAYWPGEGGHNAGLIRGMNGAPDYYLIVPAGKDAEFKAEWGGYGSECKGSTCASDGLANTLALLADGEKHPAAEQARKFAADGHSDFYLPARRELQLAEANVPDLFAKAYHWSSTQFSAYFAFTMAFEGGWQGLSGKHFERLVRPVRRKFL